MEIRDLLNLTEEEVELVLLALNKLPSSDLGVTLMMDMTENLFKKQMSPAEQDKLKKERELKKLKADSEKEVLIRKCDLVRAKIILARETRSTPYSGGTPHV